MGRCNSCRSLLRTNKRRKGKFAREYKFLSLGEQGGQSTFLLSFSANTVSSSNNMPATTQTWIEISKSDRIAKVLPFSISVVSVLKGTRTGATERLMLRRKRFCWRLSQVQDLVELAFPIGNYCHCILSRHRSVIQFIPRVASIDATQCPLVCPIKEPESKFYN